MKDYARLRQVVAHIGMIPYTNRIGTIQPGFYTLKGYEAPVWLGDCALDEKTLLKEALLQLSKSVDDSYQAGIERDLAD